MSKTEISWSQYTWNPVRGCLRVSPGCGGGTPGEAKGGCYAETMAARIVRMGGYEWIEGAWRDDPSKKANPAARRSADRYKPLVRINKAGKARWTGVFAFDEEKLAEPLRRRTPTMCFVNSMSDLFGDGVSDEQIAAVFGVMAACPQHTFQILTKRAARMVEWFKWIAGEQAGALGRLFDRVGGLWTHTIDGCAARAIEAANTAGLKIPTPGRPLRWPLPNVWLGVSCEDQPRADERIPLLLKCPAAVRWVSAEPLLGPVDLSNYLDCGYESGGPQGWIDLPSVDWVVGGGESGHDARPCALEWLVGLARQCKAAATSYFNKQLGAHVVSEERVIDGQWAWRAGLKDRKGADPAEWPEDLRVREWPRGFMPPKSKKSLPVVGGA